MSLRYLEFSAGLLAVCLLALVALFGPEPASAASRDDKAYEALDAACDKMSDAGWKSPNNACVRKCKMAERQKRWTSHAENCDYILRSAEAASVKSGACSAKSCIYRLAPKGKDGFAGSGFSARLSEFHTGGTEWGQEVRIKGPAGSAVFRASCGASCSDVYYWVSGGYKTAKLTTTGEGYVMTLPK